MEEKLDRIIELLEELNSKVLKLNPKYINVDNEVFNAIKDVLGEEDESFKSLISNSKKSNSKLT